ncbi:tRNA dimethylallyltransferase 2 [Asparagus officinalis]|uniref:tRNA dimethylallyltransferase 2 n=1 Tax=Asparagus officinalis TaxID=4686 RepID=A0A5P1FSD1_ASPOF|nr:tRNA dimethylallyltransferase 2 [Asparagus officinalis]
MGFLAKGVVLNGFDCFVLIKALCNYENEDRSVVTCISLMESLRKCGKIDEAIGFLKRVKEKGMILDGISYDCLPLGAMLAATFTLQLSNVDLAASYERLKEIDPVAANRIHPNDHRKDPQSVTSIYYVEDAENNVDDLENDADPLCAICDDGDRIVRFDRRCRRSFHATIVDGIESGCNSLSLSEAQIQSLGSSDMLAEWLLLVIICDSLHDKPLDPCYRLFFPLSCIAPGVSFQTRTSRSFII